MDIICVLPLRNQCFDIAVKEDKTESVHQSAFICLCCACKAFLLQSW